MAQSSAPSDEDILNFALNLEYLEAQFYPYATTSSGLPASMLTGVRTQGTVSAGVQMPFQDPLVQAYANEIANDEREHVAFLRSALGPAAVASIASGISSSVVGTMAGQMIMQGFVGFRIPVAVRRLVTMVPAFAVIAWGVDATNALVLSQVVLSIALPVPMIALLWFTSRSDLMGAYRNRRLTNVAAVTGTVAVLALNVVLLVQTAGVSL